MSKKHGKKSDRPSEAEGAVAERTKAEQLKHLMETGARLNDRYQALKKEFEDYKKSIKELWPEKEYGHYKAGEGHIMITEPYRRLDLVLAEKMYGDRVKEFVVTPAAIRAALTPTQVTELTKESVSIEFKGV